MSAKDTKPGFMAMKAVYSYVFPEVRPIIERMGYLPMELFLTSTPVSEAQEIIDGLGFRERLIVPSTIDGKVSLDDIHEPIIERIIQEYEKKNVNGPTIRGLRNFSYKYPTSGSSPGIFHILADAKQKGIDTIYTLHGEYEGYREYGSTLGIQTVEINSLEDIGPKSPKGLWFISNPSARDGNIIHNTDILRICDAGHKVVMDLAYVGMTKEHSFDVNHENIVGTVMSLSKPYGLFRFRTGFTFTKEPIASLYANKWFKDVGRLLLGLKAVEDVGVGNLYQKYVGKQSKIITNLNDTFNLNIRQSDVFLLGNMDTSQLKDLGISEESYDDYKKFPISRYRRADSYRFCLTPYFEEMEK